MTKKKIVIVSGATGDLGRAYLEQYHKMRGILCYALSRKEEKHPILNVQYLTSDLEDAITTKEQMQKIALGGIDEIVLIHPVGRFKFEPKGEPEIDDGHDGIDDEVYKSNVDTFHHIVKPIIEQRKKYGIIPVKLVAFGSLSDPYLVPWWGSYSKSKLILRKGIREISRIEPSVSSVFINLSSVKTGNEAKTRPYADTEFWISPEEVVEKSIPIIGQSTQPYIEIDLFNPSPDYHEDYYRNYDMLRDKWIKEMKGET